MRCILIRALKGMHMLTEIYGIYVCMHTDTHAQTHKLWSSSFKWGIGSHGNQIRSCRSHSTCHKMGNQQHAEMPDLHPVFLQHTFRHIMRRAHTHTHTHKLLLLFYGPEQRDGERERNGEAQSKMKERLRRLRWGRKRGSVQRGRVGMTEEQGQSTEAIAERCGEWEMQWASYQSARSIRAVGQRSLCACVCVCVCVLGFAPVVPGFAVFYEHIY